MRSQIYIVLSVALLLSSCKKDNPPLFTITIPNLVFSVDPTLQPPFTYYIPINEVITKARAVLDAHGLDTTQINSIRPGKAALFLPFGQGDLGFLDAVSVRLCPVGVNQENCGREVFYRDPVPLNTHSDLDLVPSNVTDVRSAVLPDRINVQIKLERLRNFPQQTFDVRLDMEFEVR